LPVQFRSDKQDLFGVTEASRIHGPIVPLVTYQGIYEELFVYTSPFAEGIPYISVLMSSNDFQLPLEKKIATVTGLANLITRGARTNTAVFDTAISNLTFTLEKPVIRSISTFSDMQPSETKFLLVSTSSYYSYAISLHFPSPLPIRISPHSITSLTTVRAGFKLY
jgi:hypothetical protein